MYRTISVKHKIPAMSTKNLSSNIVKESDESIFPKTPLTLKS